MNTSYGRKRLGVVATEVGVDALVGIYPQELVDDLHDEHLTICKGGFGSAPSDAPHFSGSVVGQAEDANDEGAKIHCATTSSFFFIDETPPR